MPFDVKHAAKIYQQISSVPNLVSARILQTNPAIVQATWKTQNYFENTSTSYIKTYASNGQGFTNLNKSVVDPESNFQSLSPSRQSSCIIRKAKIPENGDLKEYII